MSGRRSRRSHLAARTICAGAPRMTDRELRRDRDQAIAGGVCAGIAARFGYDVTLVRVVTVLFAFAVGFGVIAYLALWLLLPAGASSSGAVERYPRETTARRPRVRRMRPSAVPFTPSAARLPRGGTISPSSGRTFAP